MRPDIKPKTDLDRAYLVGYGHAVSFDHPYDCPSYFGVKARDEYSEGYYDGLRDMEEDAT